MTEPDYSYTAANAAGQSVTDLAAKPVESASASTACQTSSSKFAYGLTFGILGVIALLIIAISLLVYTAVTSSIAHSSSTDRYYLRDYGDEYEYDYGYDRGHGAYDDLMDFYLEYGLDEKDL